MPARFLPGLGIRNRNRKQKVLPFMERGLRRARLFKWSILSTTALIMTGIIGASPRAIDRLLLWWRDARISLLQQVVGLPPDRSEVEAQWQVRRQRGIEQSRKGLQEYYDGTTNEMRALFRTVGMDPDHALVRYGRGDQAFAISSQVFELDEHGRSYRFRPNTRSVWLRQITILKGPFMMFQVLDTPAHRAAATAAGAIVDDGSVQKTNSWGLRGAEPDPKADVRGIVLGDSFMQAMFNGDGDTPPVRLEGVLREAWKLPVSIVNTGHIGYSPEQYYYSLLEYGERFRPHFVVVSVCPNDFGDGQAVMNGQGDWMAEAAYWLSNIQQWCRGHLANCLIVPVPVFGQVDTARQEAFYPSQIQPSLKTHTTLYCFPLDEFIDESLGLAAQAMREGKERGQTRLYNRPINDDHLSPKGAALWAEIVGRRLIRIYDVSPSDLARPAGSAQAPHQAPLLPSIPR